MCLSYDETACGINTTLRLPSHILLGSRTFPQLVAHPPPRLAHPPCLVVLPLQFVHLPHLVAHPPPRLAHLSLASCAPSSSAYAPALPRRASFSVRALSSAHYAPSSTCVRARQSVGQA